MARFAVFLRAVNLGAQRRFPMATFREVLASVGCTDVVTLLASGQAVVSATGTPAALAARLRPRLDSAAGFDVPVVVLSAAQLAAVVEANPYRDETDPKKVHALLVQAGPTPAQRERLAVLAAAAPGERLAVVQHAVYLHLDQGFHAARLPTRVPKVLECTARNVATLGKVLAAI